jgi:hypothetical protein
VRHRRARWLSIPDVADVMLQRTNRIAERLKRKSRKRQLETVRRMVVRAELRDEVRITKRIGRALYVRFDALESMLPADVETVTRLEVAVIDAAKKTKQIQRHVNGHGSVLRDHSKRIRTLEEEQEVTSDYLAKLQEIRSRGRAAG